MQRYHHTPLGGEGGESSNDGRLASINGVINIHVIPINLVVNGVTGGCHSRRCAAPVIEKCGDASGDGEGDTEGVTSPIKHLLSSTRLPDYRPGRYEVALDEVNRWLWVACVCLECKLVAGSSAG